MSRAMIRCPETGRMVYTGMDIDWDGLEAARFVGESMSCPRCGTVHAWNETDITLDEDGCGD
jgi:hypothetical protein